MEPSVSPELEEESIIIVYAGLETGLYATNMERGGELRVFELPGRAFIFGFIEERCRKICCKQFGFIYLRHISLLYLKSATKPLNVLIGVSCIEIVGLAHI